MSKQSEHWKAVSDFAFLQMAPEEKCCMWSEGIKCDHFIVFVAPEEEKGGICEKKMKCSVFLDREGGMLGFPLPRSPAGKEKLNIMSAFSLPGGGLVKKNRTPCPSVNP